MDKQRILTPVLLAAFFAVGTAACERDAGTTTSSPPPSQRAPDASPGPGTQERSPSTSPTEPGTAPSQPGGSTGSGGTSGSGTQQ